MKVKDKEMQIQIETTAGPEVTPPGSSVQHASLKKGQGPNWNANDVARRLKLGENECVSVD